MAGSALKQHKLGITMFPIWIVTGILSSLGDPTATSLWHWFGHHVLLTVLMLIFLA